MDAENRLGEFIRERRESLGFAVGRVFAAQIDMDPTMLSRIETGRAKTLPEPGVLRKIAKALSVPMSELLAAAGYSDDEREQSPDDEAIAQLTALMRQVRWRPLYLLIARDMFQNFVANDRLLESESLPPDQVESG